MRSKLFVPGSRPELFGKALASAADGLSFDLEDAVAAERKHAAREDLAAFLQRLPETGNKTLVVRINSLASGLAEEDVQAVLCPALHVINLPKVESADEVLVLADWLDRFEAERGLGTPTRLLATIETPRGLRQAAAIATAHPRMTGLQLGLADLFEPLGIDRTDAIALHHIRLALRLAAGEAGIDCHDAAFAAVDDLAAFQAEAEAAYRLGFTGKSCIHPRQIALANQAFLPSKAAIAKACRHLAAAEQARHDGVGAYLVDGQMVDEPFLRSARRIVEQARLAGLLQHPPC